MTLAVGVFAVVLVGSLLQRVSGMGLGLLAAPVISLMIGPVEGVLLVNVLATMNALMTTLSVRRDVDWKKFASIAPYLAVGAVPGAFLIRAVSANVLLVIVGVLLLIALGAVTLGERFVPRMEGRGPAAIAGTAGGFMNTLAGAAGPAITVYSHAARWDQRTYAATLQPIFMVSGATSFAIKQLSAAGSLESIDGSMWAAGLLAMVAGIAAGTAIAPRVPGNRAHALALGLAVAGGLTALARGVLGLLS
ncbi:Sulfite exporter TauE/SafE [Corynebacterium capitovis DSM 44611]|uniref:sulfite exporter TauE/SafE family protein n=1 Tax=Corynebacterium capitovis TaxID=131081 RepID=UPI0003769462|nr:sulfite exporter TauE/SafE family protein [Corynebacterium capitovis]WKD57762.1 Sulfite exporter TauE/SafE [Corynebacterium capitovis DSM 44611]